MINLKLAMLARLEIHQGSMVYFHSFGDLSHQVFHWEKKEESKTMCRKCIKFLHLLLQQCDKDGDGLQ